VTRLLLLRHGQSTWNAALRWQGAADPPLSERGRAQARAAAQALRGERFDAVVTSDLARASETAAIVAGELGIDEVGVEPRLRERDVGAWSGLTTEEIEARWPGQLAAWRAGELAAIPEGEGDITARVMEGLDAVVSLHPGGTVLVVTHGGVIRTAERAVGVEPSSVRNVAGRWLVAGDDGVLRAGDAVQLQDPDAPAPRTTVL
jgi:broad specificity phosphatase PhoE